MLQKMTEAAVTFKFVSFCSYSVGGVVEHPISNWHLQKQLLLFII